MTHFINYHISELLQQKNNEIIKSESESIVTMAERQKMRRQMSINLIKEDWTPEAVILLEKSRDDHQSLDEYF